MDEAAKRFWDLKYDQGLSSLTKPDPFFISAYDNYIEPSFPRGGRALDLAGGLGRHSLWLAERGWDVTVADISEVALRTLRETSVSRDLDLKFFRGDAADYDFQPEKFAVIILFYHVDRRLFPMILHALKPGGLFVCKMRIRWETETVPTLAEDSLLGRDEFQFLVPNLVPLHDSVRPIGVRGVVEYVGSKS